MKKHLKYTKIKSRITDVLKVLKVPLKAVHVIYTVGVFKHEH